MNLLTGIESAEFFGGDVSPSVRQAIDELRGAPPDHVEAVLWSIAVCAPENLAVHYMLYKFHAGRGELDQAWQASRYGLEAAAHAAQLPQDWTTVGPGHANFTAPGAARFWMFTLKAQAFIAMRLGNRADAVARIDKLRLLDPADHLGAGVLEALLNRIS